MFTVSTIRSRLVLALTITAVGLPSIATAAESEILELDPHHQAMVARERMKQGGRNYAPSRRDTQQAGLGGAGGGKNSQCGSMDIGNANPNSNDPRSGGSARNRVNPRDTTVIVTGPVINAARCK